jgi:hypothetical protein
MKLQNLWDDLPPLNSQAAERLGYPTHKLEALLDRIILTSSSDPRDRLGSSAPLTCGALGWIL